MRRVHKKTLRHAEAKLYAVNTCFVILAGTCTMKAVWGNRTIEVIGTTYAAQQIETEEVKEDVQYALSEVFTPKQYTGVTVLETETEKKVEAVEVVETETEALPVEETEGGRISEEDGAKLMQIAMAEAEGEGVDGKAMVMCVVLNRCGSDSFPNDVEGVIFQPGQFTPIDDGRYFSVVPDDGCREALQMVQDGWDESHGALYFASVDYPHTWHTNNLQYLLTVGKHEFFK